MELFETNTELEAYLPEPSEEDIWDLPEKEFDYDNIDEDLSYLDDDDLSIEELSEEEEDDFSFFFGEDYKKYNTNKIYKSIPDRPISNGKVVETGKAVFRRLAQKGYDPKVLSAIIGNGVVESNLNPAALGDHGTAFGINQNRFEKADHFNREYEKLKNIPDGLDKHVIAQYNSVKNNYPSIYKKVKSAKGYNDAAMTYGKEYEKPKYLKNDRGTYAEMITMQTGPSPFKKFDNSGQSLFSNNTRVQSPFMNTNSAIGYSPAPLVLQDYAPQDWSKNISSQHIPYTPPPQGSNLDILTNLDPTGISQVVKVADAVGTKVFNGLDKAYNVSKDIKNLIAKTADAGLTGAVSILSEAENDRLFRKQLKNMYRESEADYYG